MCAYICMSNFMQNCGVALIYFSFKAYTTGCLQRKHIVSSNGLPAFYQLKIVSRIFHVTANTFLALCQKRCETNESIKGIKTDETWRNIIHYFISFEPLHKHRYINICCINKI